MVARNLRPVDLACSSTSPRRRSPTPRVRCEGVTEAAWQAPVRRPDPVPPRPHHGARPGPGWSRGPASARHRARLNTSACSPRMAAGLATRRWRLPEPGHPAPARRSPPLLTSLASDGSMRGTPPTSGGAAGTRSGAGDAQRGSPARPMTRPTPCGRNTPTYTTSAPVGYFTPRQPGHHPADQPRRSCSASSVRRWAPALRRAFSRRPPARVRHRLRGWRCSAAWPAASARSP